MPASGLDQFDVWVATPSTMDLVPLVMVPVATNALTTLPGMLLKGRYRGISALSNVGRNMKIIFEGVSWNIYVEFGVVVRRLSSRRMRDSYTT